VAAPRVVGPSGRTAQSARSAISSQISIRRRHAKPAKHRNNLSAMKSRVVDRMKQNLPTRHMKDRVVRQNRRHLACQIVLRSSFEPSAITVPKPRPRLNQKLKRVFRSGTARQPVIVHLDQSAKPNPLPIMDMSKRLKNTGVRRARLLIELLHPKRRAGSQHPSRSPGGVPNMRQQELPKLRHKQDCNGARQPSPAPPGKIKLYGSHRLLCLLVP
jgi:hypothetical protein